MSLQQLHNCNFAVEGSYSNVVNLNVITNSYYERACRTSSRNSKLSPSESISNILLAAEHLQRSAKELSHQLKLTARFECNDLAMTLDEIANETISNIFRFSLNDHQRDKHCQNQILAEIAFIQGIIDDFASKRATEPRHPLAVEPDTDLPGDMQRLILTNRRSLSASRDKIYIALFKGMASSIGKRVRCHHIDIDDFFGAQWSLPQDLCLNRQVFFSILRFKFLGGPAELVVTSEQFGVFRQDGLRAIQAPDWENVIKEGEGLQLSVLVGRQPEDLSDDPSRLECPQCRRSDKTICGSSTDGWASCLRCDSTFNITQTDSDITLNGIDQLEQLSNFRCFSVTLIRQKTDTAEDLDSKIPTFSAHSSENLSFPPPRWGEAPLAASHSSSLAMPHSLTNLSFQSPRWGEASIPLNKVASYSPILAISQLPSFQSPRWGEALPVASYSPILAISQPPSFQSPRWGEALPVASRSPNLAITQSLKNASFQLESPRWGEARLVVSRSPAVISHTLKDPSFQSPCWGEASPSAPGVQQMPSGGSPGISAWPPPLEKHKFDAKYKTYSARMGMKHEITTLMNVDGKPIDLYALHVHVMQEGGWTKVHHKELWSVIGGRMGFVHLPGSDTEPAKSRPVVAQRLSQVYKEYLSGFDQVYINWVFDNRRKMQGNQARNGATLSNISVNNAMRGQPGAQGVPGAAGPLGGAGVGLKPTFNDSVQLADPMRFAGLLSDHPNQGLPEHMTQLVEQNHANIQSASQEGQVQQAAAALRAQVPEQTPGRQPQQAPGVTGPPTPEQFHIAQNFIAHVQHELQRGDPFFRPPNSALTSSTDNITASSPQQNQAITYPEASAKAKPAAPNAAKQPATHETSVKGHGAVTATTEPLSATPAAVVNAAGFNDALLSSGKRPREDKQIPGPSTSIKDAGALSSTEMDKPPPLKRRKTD